jgi:multiple sugar transport system permease protein
MSNALQRSRKKKRSAVGEARPIAHYSIAVWLILLLTVLVPLLYGVYLSFQNYKLASVVPPSFVGFDNYLHAFNATETWSTLRITIILMLLGMAIQIPLGIGLALILHQNLKGTKFFRSVLIMPMLLTPVAVGLIFRFMFDTDLGVINWAIQELGLSKVNWLGTQSNALIAIVIVESWQSIPFVMLLVLAALAGLSKSYFEAALIDGASRFQIFFKITLPLILPTLYVIIMIKIMDFLKLFDTIFILTKGGPGNDSTTLGLWTYKTGFIFLEMSRASALGVIIAILTIPVYFLWRRASQQAKS